MADKKINPVLKQVLELGPTLAFFLIYLRIKEETYTFGGTDYTGFIVAALIFVPILLVAMGILWLLTGKLSRMQPNCAHAVDRPGLEPVQTKRPERPLSMRVEFSWVFL